ncbi:MAG: hypothetical protein IJ197_03495 [Bacteroidaceae bacterium]|nr:hypothetical protein [Bacteroidaceae bacterium]
MKIVINPKYEALRADIERMPAEGVRPTHTFCNHRNLVAVCPLGDLRVVVKRYKRPTLANCVIYTLFRKNKAQRAYENARRLLSEDIPTPEPIAYIVERRYGFVHTCWFVSEYLPWPTLGHLDQTLASPQARTSLWQSYMQLAHEMHRRHMLLRDNNSGNYLVSPDQPGRFALVDINRLQFGRRPSKHDLVIFFQQLGLPLERIMDYLPLYADYTPAWLDDFRRRFRRFERWRSLKHDVKHWAKRVFLGKK